MKHVFLFAAALLTLTGCENLTGVFESSETLNFKAKKKTITVEPGNHQAKLKFRSKKKLTLTLTEGKNKKIDFDIPKDVKLPRYQGKINLTAAQTGQPYDLAGFIDTDYSSGPQQVTWESCSYTRQFRECIRNDNGERECRDVERTYQGHRRIAYHYEYENRDLVVELKIVGTGAPVAKFDGSHHNTRRVVDREGRCLDKRL